MESEDTENVYVDRMNASSERLWKTSASARKRLENI
jgi:hypothetical protein